MHNFRFRHVVLRVLVIRALFLFGLIQIGMWAAGIDSPLGTILLTAILGYFDVRIRHEFLFWANLGYSAWQTTGVFALVAVVSESCLRMVIRPLIVVVLQNTR